jgi:hypothetical protein
MANSGFYQPDFMAISSICELIQMILRTKMNGIAGGQLSVHAVLLPASAPRQLNA